MFLSVERNTPSLAERAYMLTLALYLLGSLFLLLEKHRHEKIWDSMGFQIR
jgi:hypothetical protein